MARAFLIIIFTCYAGLTGWAQPKSYNFRKLGINEGLHDGTVRCIAQDTLGFIWIGTVGALNRFDSKKVEVFTYDMDDTTSPYSSQPRSMHSDIQGRFWVGYETGLIEYVFATGNFRKVKTLENQSIYSLLSINDTTLLIACRRGLVKLNTATDDTFWYDNSKSARYAILNRSRLNDIEYRYPYVYIASNDGLILFDIVKDSAFSVNIPGVTEPGIVSIDVDKQGDIWMCSYDAPKLTRLHKDLKKLDRFDKWLSPNENLSNTDIKDVIVDDSNNVWFISASEGIMQYVRKKDVMIKYLADPEIPSGLNTNNFRTLFKDRNGMIWAGSDIGVVYFNTTNSFFSTLMPFDTALGKRERRVGRAITIDDRGMVWMGAHDGVSVYNPETGKYKEWRNEEHGRQVLYSNWVRSICYADHSVWIGTSGGVNRYDLKTNKMEFVDPEDLPERFYNSITKDKSGNIWFGTNDTSALYWYSTEEKKYYSIHVDTALRKYERFAPVSYVFEDSKKRLWISFSRKGVVRYDKMIGTTTYYSTEQDSAHRIIGNQVIDIKEDKKGVIWLSSMNGISGINVDSGKIQNFNRNNGLVNNWVSPIVVDPYDRVWIGASGGLSMLDEDRVTMTSFTIADGLSSVGFPEHAGIIDSTGVIWMATYNGYAKFNSHEYKPDTGSIGFYVMGYQSTDVVFKRVHADDKNQLIDLQAGDNAITIDIVALNFSNPTHTRFAYRLNGFEKTWHYSQEGKAVYTNIPGGSYSFEYKAASGNMPWNKIASKQLNVEIGSFFYQKKLFWISVCIILFFSLWIYYRKRLRDQKQIYELQRQADELQKENALVMFEGLKQQLNPHFLFNSLTSLSALIYDDRKKASRFLERLSKLYRYVLNSQENETVTLEEELRFAENYFELQKTRFGDGLLVINEIDKTYCKRRIAPVTLQKLIENAVKHNIVDTDSPLIIRFYIEGEYLIANNNLQRKNFVETSNKKGLASLFRLYSYISKLPVVVEDDSNFFIVKIPLI